MIQIIMYILLSLLLTSLMTQFCTGEYDKNDKIYPWLVKIKEISPKFTNNLECYGTLIAHDVVITQSEGVPLSGLIRKTIIVESYCGKTLNGEQIGDCISSEVNTYIRQDPTETFNVKDDSMIILTLKKPLHGNFIYPIQLASSNAINEKDCFFTTWPSNISQFKCDIDLNKFAHNVNIRYGQSNDTEIKIDSFDYYNLMQSDLYSDHYIPEMVGSSLVCSLQRNPEKYVLTGIAPGYVLSICKNPKSCVKSTYFINLMNEQNGIVAIMKSFILV